MLQEGSNAFGQSVLFRVHESVNIVSDVLLKTGGDSASCSIRERIPLPRAVQCMAHLVLIITTLRTWFSITMQEQRETLFQATVTSVRLRHS